MNSDRVQTQLDAEKIAADLRHLERIESRLLAIAIFNLLVTVIAVAALANEVAHGRLDIPSRVQLDVGVRCLLASVILFALFAVYQKVNISRLRRTLLHTVQQLSK